MAGQHYNVSEWNSMGRQGLSASDQHRRGDRWW